VAGSEAGGRPAGSRRADSDAWRRARGLLTGGRGCGARRGSDCVAAAVCSDEVAGWRGREVGGCPVGEVRRRAAWAGICWARKWGCGRRGLGHTCAGFLAHARLRSLWLFAAVGWLGGEVVRWAVVRRAGAAAGGVGWDLVGAEMGARPSWPGPYARRFLAHAQLGRRGRLPRWVVEVARAWGGRLFGGGRGEALGGVRPERACTRVREGRALSSGRMHPWHPLPRVAPCSLV
jgi:hypothetical protein